MQGPKDPEDPRGLHRLDPEACTAPTGQTESQTLELPEKGSRKTEGLWGWACGAPKSVPHAAPQHCLSGAVQHDRKSLRPRPPTSTRSHTQHRARMRQLRIRVAGARVPKSYNLGIRSNIKCMYMA